MKTIRNADSNINEELSDSDSISFKENTKKSKIYYETLQLKDEKTQLTFLENEAAEKEDTCRSTDTLADRKVLKKPNMSDQQICRYSDNFSIFIIKTT